MATINNINNHDNQLNQSWIFNNSSSVKYKAIKCNKCKINIINCYKCN